MYYTVIKHGRHLRRRRKCRKREPQASVLHFSSVLKWLECNTRLRRKTIKHAFLYSDKTWVFDQSERTQGPIYMLAYHKETLCDWYNFLTESGTNPRNSERGGRTDCGRAQAFDCYFPSGTLNTSTICHFQTIISTGHFQGAFCPCTRQNEASCETSHMKMCFAYRPIFMQIKHLR